MSSGLYSGVSGLALGTGLYRDVSGLWSGASGLIAGFDGGNPYGGASLYLDFLTMTAPTFDSRITFSRGSNATLVDSTGKITYAPANLLLNSSLTGGTAGVEGSGAVAPTNWSFPVGTGSVSYPAALSGVGTAVRFVASAQRPFISQTNLPALVANTNYIYSAYVEQVASGSPTIRDVLFYNTLLSGASVTWYINGIAVADPVTTVVAAGQRISAVWAIGATGGNMYPRLGPGGVGSATGDITLSSPQFEPVTYQTTPRTYQATTSTAYYGPRFDYDPVTLAAKGLLIEEQRTNLSLTSTFATLAGSAGSQYPSGTGWSNFFSTGGTRTYVASSVFSGAQAMDIASVSAARNVIGFSFTPAASTTYTVSFYVESVSGATGIVAYATGTLGTGGASNNVSAPTATGRYSYTFTTGTAPGTVDLRFGIGCAGNESGSIRISNVQCEAGSFATSYIPTVASTVTRAADVASMTGSNFSAWYNQAEGTLVAGFTFAVAQPNFSTLPRFTGAADSVGLSPTSGTAITGYQRVGGVTQMQTALGTSQIGTSKAAVAYGSTSCTALNGTAGSSVAGSTAGAMNSFVMGMASNYFHNPTGQVWLRSIAYYNTRLPNAQLQSLTA